WDLEQGDSTIIVAIIDTGVEWLHEDLNANIWQNLGEDADGDGHTLERDGNGEWIWDPGDLNGVDDDPTTFDSLFVDDLIGWDFVDIPDEWDSTYWAADGEDGTVPDNDPADFAGHGTHCSGIAAAVTDNGAGIAAIGWNTTIMPVRAGYLKADGLGSIIAGYEGILYAADNGADIISLSWGGGGANQFAQEVINYAWELGVLIIGAAGNESSDNPFFPAAYDHVLAVSATRKINDNIAGFSNYGTWVDICAPGELILSTYVNGVYVARDGTSMAAPMVAGGAALLMAQFPTASNHDIALKLVVGADYIDDYGTNPTKAGELGSGRMNVYNSLVTTETPQPILAVTQNFSDVNGDNDGLIETGETIELVVTLENQYLGGKDYNLVLTLASDDYAIDIISGVALIDSIAPLAVVDNVSQPFVFAIAGTAIPHRARFTLQVTGDSSSHVFDLALSIGKAALLLVDDDDGLNNVESYYFNVLDSIGLPFDYWPRIPPNTAPTNLIDNYGTVIWLTEWAFPSLEVEDRNALAVFLAAGGNLFLSGQDIGWDLCENSQYENEYSHSSGASLAWYEEYLHARYLEDDAAPGALSVEVHGSQDNPIGSGLVFDISQPGRDAENQYPSVIEPLGDAQTVFQYPDGRAGATMWAGTNKVVYYAFGFEAVTGESNRFTVMSRVLKWLNDLELEHQPVGDSENSSNPYIIEADLNGELAQLDSTAIYWSLDGQLPYNIEIMTEISPGVFSGSIPAQPAGTTVHYFIYSASQDGYIQTSPAGAPLTMHSFYIGIDASAPVISAVTPSMSTIDNSGNYSISAEITDNLGIDPSATMLHFRHNDNAEDSVLMYYNSSFARFEGQIDLGHGAADGDSIIYYVSAIDLAANKNRTVSAIERLNIVNVALIGEFETDLNGWVYTDGWRPVAYGHTGTQSAKQSPIGISYESGRDHILEYGLPLNLTHRSTAYLEFWHIFAIAASDTAFVEVRGTDGVWQPLTSFTGNNNYIWQSNHVSLSGYLGQDDVHARFRIHADAASAGADGWYLDDISILADTTLLEINAPQQNIPITFRLEQNYPNPFNPNTRIKYQLPVPGQVRLELFNIRGQSVKVLVDDYKIAGYYEVLFRSTGLASGLYLYRMTAPGFSMQHKLIILK
ncbi:MAG: S8 family peptidase, partial [Candidatus Marinimicrobia bacterium]|nr:S8 family peptidase [Candidatus Neomarinimicrobiota bacterium]